MPEQEGQEAQVVQEEASREAVGAVVEGGLPAVGTATLLAARALAPGGAGLAPRQGVSPAALLGLQRTTGNRATAQLLRKKGAIVEDAKLDDIKINEPEEFATEPLVIENVSGPNEAVKIAASLASGTRKWNFISLDSSSAYVYDDKLAGPKRFPFSASLAWTPGIWISRPGENAFHRVMRTGDLVNIEEAASEISFQRPGKLAKNAAKEKDGSIKTSLDAIITDKAGLEKAIDPAAWICVLVPRYAGGGKQSMKPKFGKAQEGSDAAGLTGQTKGDPPNRPPWPSEIRGPDLQVPGGHGNYQMELFYGTNVIDSTLDAMNWVTFTWEQWDISDVAKTKDAPEAALASQDASRAKKDKFKEKDWSDNVSQRWKDSYDEEAERLSLLYNDKRLEGQTDESWRWQRYHDVEAIGLAPFSWLVDSGGNLLSTVVDARPRRRQEIDMPWPKKEGVYLIRCVAQPDTRVLPVWEGTKRTEQTETLRYAPSISTLIIEVREPRKVATESLDKADAELEATQANLKLAEMMGASEKELTEMREQVERAKVQAVGSVNDILRTALADKNKTLGKTSEADIYARRDLDEAIASIKNQLDTSGKRILKVQGTDPPAGVVRGGQRIPATFVSAYEGMAIPLLLDLVECPDSKDGAFHYVLSDITSPNSDAMPEGRSDTRRKAIINAVDQYAKESGLGKGVVTVRVPQAILREPETDGKKPEPMTYTVNAFDIGKKAAKKRLDDMILIASLVATVLLGPAPALAGRMFMVIGAVGAAAAANHLMDRHDNGTLRFDSSAVQDVIAIVSFVLPAVAQTIGQLRMIPLGRVYVFATAEGLDEMAVHTLKQIQAVENAVQAAQHVATALGGAGVFIAGADAIEEIQKINRRERNGEIGHNEAARMRASAFSNALTNQMMFVYGHEMGKKAASANERAPQEKGKTKGTPQEKGVTPEKSAAPHEKATVAPEKGVAPHEKAVVPEGHVVPDPATIVPPEVKAIERPGAGGDPPDHKPPSDDGGGGPREPSKKVYSKLEASLRFRESMDGKRPPEASARDLINSVGDWKSLIKKFIGGLGKQKPQAEEALVKARDTIVEDAWNEVQSKNKDFAMLEKFNVGTKAFGSDIDITVKPKNEHLNAPGADHARLIQLSSEAAALMKEALRSRVNGHETDVAIDTNIYSYIGENKVVAGTPEERAARSNLDRVLGMAELLRGGKAGFTELLAQMRAKLVGQPEAVQKLNQIAVEAKRFFESRVAEEAQARKEVKEANRGKKVSAATENRMVRDKITEAKKAELAKEVGKKEPDLAKITSLQSEILWFEPDAYATRSAIEQAVSQAQSLKAAGQDVTPEGDVAAAKKALDAAKGSKDPQVRERAQKWFDEATRDRNRIQAAEDALQKVLKEPRPETVEEQKAHDWRKHKAQDALDSAREKFRQRVVDIAIKQINADLDARGYTGAEQRALGSGAAASNMGMMESHVAHEADVGKKVKYVCKYGGRVLLSLFLAGVRAEGSIAAEAMLSMFTQSRWAFNEGPAGELMMREMLIKYATSTGKKINVAEARAVGVPPEVQAAFVKDMMSFLRGATSKLWAIGITEEVFKGGVADDVRAAEVAAEEAAGAADPQFDNPGLAKAFEARAKREQTVRENLEGRIEKELSAPAKTDDGEYKPSQSMEAKDLPKTYRDAMEKLAGRTDADSVAVRERMPIVLKALRTPKYFAKVLAEAAMLAKAKNIGINEALIELAKQTGLKVYVLDKSPPGGNEAFFRKVVGRPEYFVDDAIGSDHGHMTHLLQDLAVDRALTEAGYSERSPQLRARLNRLNFKVGNLSAGDALWRGTYDNENYTDFGTPETLTALLARFGLR